MKTILAFHTAVALLNVTLVAGVSGYTISEKSADKSIYNPGDTATLKCVVEDYFEFCNWYHESTNDVCEFEWKYKTSDVEMQRCSTRIKSRASYNANYKKHECSLTLKDVNGFDEGVWKCDIESYTWGPARGYKTVGDIFVRVKQAHEGGETFSTSTTTTTTTSTTAANAEEEIIDNPFVEPETHEYDESLDNQAVNETVSQTMEGEEEKEFIEPRNNIEDIASSKEDERTLTGRKTQFDYRQYDQYEHQDGDHHYEIDDVLVDNDISAVVSADHEILGNELGEAEGQKQESFPFLFVILGSFGTLFLIMVVGGSSYYHYRRGKVFGISKYHERGSSSANTSKNDSYRVNMSGLLSKENQAETTAIMEEDRELNQTPIIIVPTPRSSASPTNGGMSSFS